MAQQILNPLVTAPDDGNGETPFAWGGKINSNFTELYTAVTDIDARSPNKLLFINEEEAFPTQTASTITIEAGFEYFISDAVVTSKSFICEGGSIKSTVAGGVVQLTYTGSAPMFSSVNNRITLSEIVIDCPNAVLISASGSGAFNPSERVNLNRVEVVNCVGVGDLSSLGGGIVVSVCLFANVTGSYGFKFSGSGTIVNDMQRFAIGGLQSGAIGIDFDSATANGYEIRNYIPIGDAAAIPISGLSSSGNVNAGGLMKVFDCSFDGFTTPLSGIDVDDVRVDFGDNTGLQDSKTFAYFCLDAVSSPETLTTGATGTYAELITTNFTEISVGRWSVSNAGVATFNGERSIRAKIQGFASATNAGGGSDTITVRAAANWTGSADSGLPCSGSITDNNNPTTLAIIAETQINPGDEVNVIWSNLSNGSNIEVSQITIVIEEL